MGGKDLRILELTLASLDASQEQRRDAFGQLLAHYDHVFKKYLSSYNKRLINGCDDVLQDAGLQAWLYKDSFDPSIGAFKNWFGKILIRTAQARARSLESEILRQCLGVEQLGSIESEEIASSGNSVALYPPHEPEAERDVLASETIEILSTCVDEVVDDPTQRFYFEALLMHEFDGLRWKEIKESLAYPGQEGTLRTAACRLRSQLKSTYQKTVQRAMDGADINQKTRISSLRPLDSYLKAQIPKVRERNSGKAKRK